MSVFDQFVKHTLKVKKYVRYTDDFIIVSHDRNYLESLFPPIEVFLRNELALSLHPNKVEILNYSRGIDFLGYVVHPHYRLVRKKTKNRMFRKPRERVRNFKRGIISEVSLKASLRSYLGVLSHTEACELEQELRNQFWYWMSE
jgi:RNA-directed DNA polymerase